ncbi:MAG: toll/interleukin-1 receptor domain-containing protein [Rubrivivax sp.]|nr:toll/interleukin-1 receptor domain-containing protein [Rubrivivax sp.]
MLFSRRQASRIFINYRRDDTGGTAGRLSDSLARYFGPDRVFRDVDGIAAGANFEDVLQRAAQDADAMIVLIGRQWTRVTDDRGQVRLHDPDDWVAREIASALERGIPVYPVLAESAQMPRAEELPESLKPLVRHNAVALSDQRWASDVLRLARIVAIDIPGSLAERTLVAVQWLVSFALACALVLPAILIALDQFRPASLEPLFARATSGVAFVVILASAVLLVFHARLVDASVRHWVLLAAAVGLGGSLVAWLWVGLALNARCEELGAGTAELLRLWSEVRAPAEECRRDAGSVSGINHPGVRWVVFACSTVTATAMLALMNLSRFKPR